ncbi:hypothetical protein FHP25_15650 [Vineibacter terrae]|uniref:Outer membrane beta-barrel protein n=1 Tax=Vineibacter terrae TaxID=2586908 RepID=A0A5C8PLL1_9HYPH|nr:outer membrane beta-barrel protein [Vineibacter terrae]TXL74845.1 hypothetical protein FHP25_15650 [Vineibacter terrae]
MRISSTFRAGRSFAVFLAVCGGMAGALDSLPASAQYSVPATTPTPPRRPAAAPAPDDLSARDASVLRRPRADPPDGVPIGSFVLFPRIEVDGEYDDNVFRTRNNRESDFIFRVRPGLTLSSDWDQHGLDLYALGEIGRYADLSSENYEAFTVGGRGRVDLTDELIWTTYGEFSRNALSRGAPALFALPSAERTIVNVITGGTDLTYNGDPFYGRIGPRFRRFDYVQGGSSQDNFNVFDISGRIGYRITPEFSVFVDPSYEWVRYDKRSFGIDQDNEGFDVRLGVSYDVTRTITAEFGGGYYRRTYDDPNTKPQSGFSFLGRLYWNPLDNVSIEAEARRSFSQYRTNLSNAVAVGNAIETYFGIRAGWEPFDPLLIDGGVAYAQYRYPGQGFKEDYWFVDIGAKYFINRNFYLGPRYFFEHRTARPSAGNYNDNRFLFTIGAQL